MNPVSMLQKRPPVFLIFLAFASITIVAYWQVAFLQNPLKWDLLGCYLPWRYHVGECIQNGIFPFWNPYTHGGYPIHADLRSVWYPETFILGLTTGYSYLTMHLLFILHISLAGTGIYLLCRHFTKDWRAGFLSGAVYLTSGFFVGHGQEMFGIIAATWIPYVLYYFILLQKERRFIDVIRTAIFSFLLVTGGYQAMWAILIYLMLAVFIVYLISDLHTGNKKQIWQLLKVNILLVLVTGLSLAVIAVTFFQVSPHVGRLGGVSIEEAWFMPFSPHSLISFLFPFATVKDIAWYDTDISMNNAYVGLITLIYFLSALFSKRSILSNVFLIFGLIALLASFGKYTPVRAVLYQIFPLMDLFRHSSFFVYFTVIAIIPVAASGFGNYFSDPGLYKRKLLWKTFSLALIIILLLIFEMPLINLGSFTFFRPIDDFAEWLKIPSRHEHLVLNALIQLVLLILFLSFVLFQKGVRLTYLLILMLIDMMVSVQLNIYYSVVTTGVSPKEINHFLSTKAEGFPLPVPGTAISTNTERMASHSVILQNTNIFNKTVSFEGYNSFRLNGFESLVDSFPELTKSVLQNGLIFLSDKILPFTQYNADSSDSLINILYIDNVEIPENYMGLQLTAQDSVIITAFHPGYAEAQVDCKGEVAVTLLQSAYPGWRVFIDDKESNLFVSDKTLISTICGPGKHRLRYVYKNRPVLLGFAISYLTIIILLSFLIYLTCFNRRKKIKILAIAIFWLIILSAIFFRFNPFSTYEQEKLKTYQTAAREIVKSGVREVVCNIDDQSMMEDAFNKAGYTGRYFISNLTYQSGLREMIDYIDHIKNQEVAFLSLFAPVPDIADAAFKSNRTGHRENTKLKWGSLSIFSESMGNRNFSSLNDFERPVAGWDGNTKNLDSLNAVSGKFSNLIDSLNSGSYSYSWKPISTQVYKPFEVLVKAKIHGRFSGAGLYIQLHKNGKLAENYGFNSGTWQLDPEQWSTMAGYCCFPEGIGENDEVRVFFWGAKQSDFCVDDFSVSILF